VGRDKRVLEVSIEHSLVSIHAPAWGATVIPVEIEKHLRVSIHAPAWGATFTLRELLDEYKVSIHAPAWGATSFALIPARYS